MSFKSLVVDDAPLLDVTKINQQIEQSPDAEYPFVVGENPHNLEITWDSLPANIRPLFAVPYVEQGSEAWLSLKQDYLSGNEIAKVLLREREDDEHNIFQSKTAKLVPQVFDERTQIALDHGVRNESVAATAYADLHDTALLKFGFIPHRDPDWYFLGVSPDRISIHGQLLEIKCPRYRKIEIDENQEGVRIYLPQYYHQVQLQIEVLRSYIPDLESAEFVQYGTKDNENYLNSSSLICTQIKRDPEWMSENGPKLRDFWHRVENHRRKFVNWRTSEPKKYVKRKYCPFDDNKSNKTKYHKNK